MQQTRLLVDERETHNPVGHRGPTELVGRLGRRNRPEDEFFEGK